MFRSETLFWNFKQRQGIQFIPFFAHIRNQCCHLDSKWNVQSFETNGKPPSSPVYSLTGSFRLLSSSESNTLW